MAKPVYLPRTTAECLALISDHPGALVYSGGTDLLVKLRSGAVDPDGLICLERLADLRVIEDRGDHLWLGAAATHQQLITDPLVERHAPLLAKAAATVGGPAIRHMGTLGGNIVTASPAGDTLPPLYLYGAAIEIAAIGASRTVRIENFIQGPGRVDLKRGELVVGVQIPKLDHFTIEHFEKVGQRNALAIAVVSLAALIRLNKHHEVEDARLAWGSVGPTIIRSLDLEKCLVGRPLTPDLLAQAVEIARTAVRPIGDIRASADYRRQVAGNLLLRLESFAVAARDA